MFVRNDNTTRLLAGDIYQSQAISAVVELKTGPLGIVLPLRGTGQMSFTCSLAAAPKPLLLSAPHLVPELLELPPAERGQGGVSYRAGHGVIVSSVFSLRMTNTLNRPLLVTFSIEPPRGVNGSFTVQPAARHNDPLCLSYLQSRGVSGSQGSHRCRLAPDRSAVYTAAASTRSVSIAPGQTLNQPMELLVGHADEESYERSRSVIYTPAGLLHPASAWSSPALPCRKGVAFAISAIPSRGETSFTQLEFNCRKFTESVLFSFVDHDGSVSQVLIRPQPRGLLNPKTLDANCGCV